MAAGVAALDAEKYYRENALKIQAARTYTTEKLKELGFCVIPSMANFVFAAHPKIDGGVLYSELKRRGILVRHFSSARIAQYNRITIGTMEQMELLIRTVADILGGN